MKPLEFFEIFVKVEVEGLDTDELQSYNNSNLVSSNSWQSHPIAEGLKI